MRLDERQGEMERRPSLSSIPESECGWRMPAGEDDPLMLTVLLLRRVACGNPGGSGGTSMETRGLRPFPFSMETLPMHTAGPGSALKIDAFLFGRERRAKLSHSALECIWYSASCSSRGKEEDAMQSHIDGRRWEEPRLPVESPHMEDMEGRRWLIEERRRCSCRDGGATAGLPSGQLCADVGEGFAAAGVLLSSVGVTRAAREVIRMIVRWRTGSLPSYRALITFTWCIQHIL